MRGRFAAMHPMPTNHLRLARPSRDLQRAERFWASGLGLDVLYRTGPYSDGPNALLMLGWPEATWHLELVADPTGVIEPSPTDEDLLVLYIGGTPDDDWLERLIAAGGRRVDSHNPYWDRWGITVVDPDGYRLVLSRRTRP